MGRVVFIGAGPGAADRLTLRGAARLAQAQVVLFDALTDPALRSFAPAARWIDVGKRGYGRATAQPAIDALLVAMARTHDTVVRLKGGDPGIFGRLEEELGALREAGIECEIVPGITAALAAAACTQRPLTRRGQGRCVSLATAVTRDGTRREAGDASPAQAPQAPHARGDTEVYYMAGRQLGRLGRSLQARGWAADATVAVVSRAGCDDALHSDHRLDELGCAALLHAGRPTVVTIGVGAQPLAPRPKTRKAMMAASASGSVQTPST